MAIRNLNNWLDKHEWEISDNFTTEYYEEDEELKESGFCGYLNKDDVMIASDEATAETHKQEYLKDNEDEIFEDWFNQLDEDFKEEMQERYKEATGQLTAVDLSDCEFNVISDRQKKWILSDYEEEIKEYAEEKFWDERNPDDYMPIWLRAWEFPSGYTVEELNEFNISGIVFFDINRQTFVSLTSCGMDMSPSLEYAYFMYSNVGISKAHIKRRLFKQPSYFSYVVGSKDFRKLCEELGITQRKLSNAEKRVGERLKQFNESLDNLSKLRDSGKITQTEAGLLGLMQYCKHNEEEKEEVKQMI